MSGGNRFQILSLSGGGYFGLYTVTVLAMLEREMGRPLARAFDLITGTSVGGIIAAGIAAEKPLEDIKQAFIDNGQQIFSNRGVESSFRHIGRSLLWSKYDGVALRNTIYSILGNTAFGDLNHRLLIPTVNLSAGQPSTFKTPHHENFRDHVNRPIAEVCLATAAAPTYFPIATIGNALHTDGGLYANSPDMLAMHEAEYFLGIPTTDIHVLSVGTTTARFSLSHKGPHNMGILAWFRNQRLIRTILATQQMSVDYMMQHKLGDRYFRLDHPQSPEQQKDLALDVATPQAQSAIQGMAEATYQTAIGRKPIRDMIAHVAPLPAMPGK